MVRNIITALIIGSVLMVTIGVWMKSNDISTEGMALRMLSSIKKIMGRSVPVDNYSGSKDIPPSHDLWGRMLNKYVSESGEVNYDGFLEDRDSLNAYLNLLSDNPPGIKWSEKEEFIEVLTT